MDGGLGTGWSVVDEGSVPADHGQIVGIVGNARLQNFLAFAIGERLGLAAHDLGDAGALRREDIGGGGCAGNLAQVEDEIVLLQPLGGVRLDQRGSGALQFLLHDASCQALEVGVPNPAAGELHQLVPVAGKGQLEDHADHAVVEILDVALQALAAFKNQRFEDLFNRRTLVSGRIRERRA